MGKSTILTHLAFYSGFWIIRIDLNDYTDKLLEMKKLSIFEKMQIGAAIELLQKEVLNLGTTFEKEPF